MKIYLDNCCFNRPFDNQSQIRIKLEAEAKLKIQDEVKAETLELVWSYVLDYENSKNPFDERRKQIHRWRDLSSTVVQENDRIIQNANRFISMGVQKFDALHIACAIDASCDYFLTTDDKVLNKDFQEIRVLDPFAFIKETDL